MVCAIDGIENTKKEFVSAIEGVMENNNLHVKGHNDL